MNPRSLGAALRSRGQLLVPPRDAMRVERQWSAIDAQRGRAPASTWSGARRWRALAVAVAIACAFALGATLRPAPTLSSWEGATIEMPASGTLKLSDGTEIAFGAGTAIHVATWTSERVVLALDHGEVTLDVPHVAGRAWVVVAGPFEARVVGTRFVVRREQGPDGERVTVQVLRGRVEVGRRDQPGDAHMLTEGESWTGTVTSTVGAVTVPSPATSASAELDAPTPPSTASASSTAGPAPSEAAPAAGPSWEELAKAHKYQEAYSVLGADGFARAVDAAGPEKVFRLAEVARAAGRLREAARAFDTLRTKHRGDGRAGLAAFELGRLRLDSLGNPSGAAEAFADAMALSRGGPFREDAEARRVQALQASGATAACVSARDAYLARYPSGAHATLVRTQCQGR